MFIVSTRDNYKIYVCFLQACHPLSKFSINSYKTKCVNFKGCGRLWVVDGQWKLMFAHCMMKRKAIFQFPNIKFLCQLPSSFNFNPYQCCMRKQQDSLSPRRFVFSTQNDCCGRSVPGRDLGNWEEELLCNSQSHACFVEKAQVQSFSGMGLTTNFIA